MKKPFICLCMFFLSASLYADELPQLGKSSIDEVVKAMTLDEKIRLLTGTGEVAEDVRQAIGYTEKIVPGAAGTTYPIPRLGIPAMVMADGPAGVRINSRRKGSDRTYYCTAFPVATVLASTWNTPLVQEVGEAMGKEALEYGCDVLLAPALNIHRNPLCGRNYEYYSEDPYLAGEMATAMVNGIQSNGVGTSVKHFAVNNQETNRIANNAIVSERALREIYLKPFEKVVKDAAPWTVMSSYNKVNGEYTSESEYLLTEVLRNQWGYEGMVVSDWFGGRQPIKQVKAGNDLLMPGMIRQQKIIHKAVESGKLSVEDIDRNVKRVLELILKTPRFKQYAYSENPDLKAHALVTRNAAAEGMVLLENKKQTLPLAASVKNVAVFGNTSYRFISGGTGSGDVDEAYTISLEEGLTGAGLILDQELKKQYVSYITDEEKKIDCEKFNHVTPPRIHECPVSEEFIAEKAQESDIAMITIGRNAGEYSDRRLVDDFDMCEDERQLLDKVCRIFHKAGKKVVVILNIGGVVETNSWKNLPDAILLAWQGGQEGGNSVADILLGKVNPSGRLPMTFPVRYEDAGSAKNFPVIELDKAWHIYREFFTGYKGPERPDIDFTKYEEDIYVGYRYFDKNNLKVSYPFGYGLSYTQFNYGHPVYCYEQEGLEVSCTVTNTGKSAGKEVVQLYVSAPGKVADKPEQELKSFQKTRVLQPGETQIVTFRVPAYDLTSFDEQQNCWVLEAGKYKVSLGSSSRESKLTGTVEVKQSVSMKR